MKVTIPKPIPGEEHKKIEVDDWDIWNVDYTLACVIHPVLLKYRENLTGYPELWEDGMITSHNYDRQLHFDIFDEKGERDYLIKKWKDTVDKMCRAFGMIVEKETWEDTWLESRDVSNTSKRVQWSIWTATPMPIGQAIAKPGIQLQNE